MKQNTKNVEDIYLLPPTQYSMLLYLLLEHPEAEMYFEQYTCTLVAPFDPAAWREAWQAVLDRHAVLRTQFLWAKRDRPLQVVRRDIELPWHEEDWREMSEEGIEGRWETLLATDVARGFDLGQAPLMRCTLVRVSEDRYKFLWAFSHLLLDGWSMALVLNEVSALYRNQVSDERIELSEVVPFRNYVAWAHAQDLPRAERFWRRELAGFDAATPLPFDGTGPRLAPGERRSLETDLVLEPELAEALSELARRQHVTLSTLFQAAWALVLGRFTGQSDVAYGVLCSGRPADLPGVDRMVGLFINALPARVRIDPGAPLAGWLADLQERVIELREFEYVPGEQVRAWSDLPRRQELFRSVVIFENYPVDPLGRDAEAVRIEDASLREAGNFPLALVVSPQKGTVRAGLLHHRDHFSPAAIGRLLASLVATLRSFADNPDALLGEIEVASGEDLRQALKSAVGPRVARPEGLLHGPFERVASEHGERIALVVPNADADARDREISYRELEARSRQLALQLRELGVGPDVRVGLMASRSAEVVVGMLGVLRAGGCYVPIDPDFPSERVAFTLEDSGARLLLVAATAAEGLAKDSLPDPGFTVVTLDAGAPLPEALAELPAGPVAPQDLAYVIYTSGSTGRPKGVGVPHAAALHYVQDSIEVYGVTEQDRLLQFSSVAFDTCVEEVYPALSTGATLVLRQADATRLMAQVERRAITVLNLPTAFWADLTRELTADVGADAANGGAAAAIPPRLRVVIIGGEEAQADHVAAWHKAMARGVNAPDQRPPTLFNTYGPTESTVVTTRADLTALSLEGRATAGSGKTAEGAKSVVPIGRPIANAAAYVLDRSMRPQPEGVDGELYLGGRGTARGYLGKPSLTAAVFVPDPFTSQPGARLYKSGDLARLLPDGQLEFRGRVDHQVKVRGYRVELGEIEIALRAIPGVRDAVATVRADRGDDRIVGYWVPAAGPKSGEQSATAPLNTASLRAALAERLPEFMMPAHFVELAEIPMTATGKVDRRALPAPGPERPGLASEYVPPRNPTEEVLAGIWSELLGVEEIGVHDDFFELGGHSLLVARMTARVRAALGVEVPMAALFDHSTVAGLATVVAEGNVASDVPEAPPLVAVPRDGRKIPLSLPQERVWFLDRLSGGGNRAYNFQVTIWFHGLLDVAAFHRGMAEIVRRHEVLRTSFPEVGGEPVQRIHPPGPVSMPVVDLSGLSEVQASELSERLVFTATQIPFDLSSPSLIRWWLLRMDPSYHELIQVEHHFVHDGWSFSVFLNELKELYRAYREGLPSPLPELPVQYADYALWQRAWMEGEVMDHLLGYWRKQLEGAPTALDLPTDRPRPVRPSFEGDMNLYAIPTELYQKVRAFGRREGFTLYMTSLAAFFVFLYRYSGQRDMLVGTTNANRKTAELEKLLGMLVNTLVLRGDLGGDPTFRQLLARVRETTLGAYGHQDMPLERLVQAIDPERHVGRNPLFQVLFQFHDAAIPDLDFAGEVEAKYLVRGNRTAKMDLTVIIIPRAEQRVGMAESDEEMRAVLHWEYSTELFDEATIHRQVQHFLNLLSSAVEDPDLRLSELPMLDEAETLQLTTWNEQARRPVPEWTTVAQAFALQAARRPEAPAVAMASAPDEGWSYAELAAQTDRLAAYLMARGIGPEKLVAVALHRSPRLVATLLAVAKVGAAYLPLDPDFPPGRLAFMLEDAGAALLLTEEALLGRLPTPACPVVALDRDDAAIAAAGAGQSVDPTLDKGLDAGRPSPSNLAYLLYTSGSTGKPKGVEVPYGALANFLGSMAEVPGFTAADTLLAVTTLSFDIAGLELYLPLVRGGRLVLAETETALSGSRLAEAIERSGATAMQATPATWRLLLDAGWRPADGLSLLCGGEALPPSLVAELAGAGGLWNLYGPTETTVWSTVEKVDGEEVARVGKVSIGHPIANTGLYLSSADWELAPVGVHGQLLIGGAGLARGYRGRPGLTAERFRPDPFSRRPGERLYATGDLAQRRADGRLDFLGRVDHQVKVRGFRIELGEIEVALSRHPQVGQSVVVARPAADGASTLVAYLVPAGGAVSAPVAGNGSGPGEVAEATPELTVDALVEYLRRSLPGYMVPAGFVMLESLPLTPNGKVDRKALPEPGGTAPLARAEFVAPRTPLEEHLAGLWAEILRIEQSGIERIGVHDSFFVIGGHSLAAGRVLARVRDRVGVDLPLSVMFDTPTIAALASEIEAAGGALDGAEKALQDKAAAMSDDELDALLGTMLTEGGSR